MTKFLIAVLAIAVFCWPQQTTAFECLGPETASLDDICETNQGGSPRHSPSEIFVGNQVSMAATYQEWAVQLR